RPRRSPTRRRTGCSSRSSRRQVGARAIAGFRRPPNLFAARKASGQRQAVTTDDPVFVDEGIVNQGGTAPVVTSTSVSVKGNGQRNWLFWTRYRPEGVKEEYTVKNGAGGASVPVTARLVGEARSRSTLVTPLLCVDEKEDDRMKAFPSRVGKNLNVLGRLGRAA